MPFTSSRSPPSTPALALSPSPKYLSTPRGESLYLIEVEKLLHKLLTGWDGTLLNLWGATEHKHKHKH